MQSNDRSGALRDAAQRGDTAHGDAGSAAVSSNTGGHGGFMASDADNRDASMDASGSGGRGGSGGHGGPSAFDGGRGGAGAGGSSGHTGDGGTDASSRFDAGASGDDGGQNGGIDAGVTRMACRAPVGSPTTTRACPRGAPVRLKATEVARVSAPVFLTHSPKDPDKRLFVLDQFGRIVIIKNGQLLSTPFLDLTSTVMSGDLDERGLLGLAFDPDYEATGRFWVNYTAVSSGPSGIQTLVESYRVSSNPDLADATTRQPLISYEQPEANHNGGMLAFGPDGCLYIAAGDGGGGGDAHSSAQCPNGNGQCLETELGKLLRLDVDHPDTAAPGNIMGAGVPHIWDYGLRNPWRFSFDRLTGDLYIGDVGQDTWEEIDIELKGTGHHNYGWRTTEGKHCSSDAAGSSIMCTDHGVNYDYRDFAAPAYDYPHAGSDDCIIGGYVYRGSNIPSLRGYYLFADFGSQHVWAMAWNGSDPCGAPIDVSPQLQLASEPTSFGEDVDGELYITSLSGSVMRIDPQ